MHGCCAGEVVPPRTEAQKEVVRAYANLMGEEVRQRHEEKERLKPTLQEFFGRTMTEKFTEVVFTTVTYEHLQGKNLWYSGAAVWTPEFIYLLVTGDNMSSVNGFVVLQVRRNPV